jgi:hypothetical protein
MYGIETLLCDNDFKINGNIGEGGRLVGEKGKKEIGCIYMQK